MARMKQPDVIVIGAGIVGIRSALSLRRRGFSVLLVDRKDPAMETSHGNSGVIFNGGIQPLAQPVLLQQALKLLLNRDSRLRIKYSHLPQLTPWLLRFIANCNTNTAQFCSEKIAPIVLDALPRHKTLMQQAGASYLLRPKGWLRVNRTKHSFSLAKESLSLFDKYGVKYQVLDAAGVQSLEPDLGIQYAGGIWLNETHTVDDPQLLCKKYFSLAQSQGVEYVRQEVQSLTATSLGWKVGLDVDKLSSSRIVVAMGAWSNDLLKPLEVALPYVMERGYHMMFNYAEGGRLQRSILDVDTGYCLTPMANGIRATTAANLVARDTPPDWRQLDLLMPEITQTIALGSPQLNQPWMGRRGSTPDSLPLIGPIPQHQKLWVVAGHCHLGLTLGPISGELIADEVCGNSNPICKPFYPARF